MAINQIAGALSGVTSAVAGGVDTTRTAAAGPSPFASMLDAVEGTSADANTAVAGMLDGSVDVHDAMIALQRADMTLQLSVQIRNKLVQTYQEIMRMPV